MQFFTLGGIFTVSPACFSVNDVKKYSGSIELAENNDFLRTFTVIGANQDKVLKTLLVQKFIHWCKG